MTATVILSFIGWSFFLTIATWKAARKHERAAALERGIDNLAEIYKAHKKIENEKNNSGDGGKHPVKLPNINQLRGKWRNN